MKRCLVAGCLMVALALSVGSGHGGPVEGSFGKPGFRLPGGFEGRTEKIRFEGGKRASIILIGDHDPPVDLKIEVFDDNGRLVALDDGAGDYAGVVWYPPVTATYTIKFTNPQQAWNDCYIVMK